MAQRTFACTVAFLQSAKIIPPQAAAIPSSGIAAGELYYSTEAQQLFVGKDATTMDGLVMELIQGGGVTVSGSGGRLTLGLDGTVVKTSGTYSGMTSILDLAAGRVYLPQGTGFPSSPSEGDVFWRTDQNRLYVYDVVGASWLRSGSSGGYYHDQGTPSTTWTATHEFGTDKITFTCYNSSGEVISPDAVGWPDTDTMTFTFLTAQQGWAVMFGV